MPIIGFVNGAPFMLIEGYIVPMLKARGSSYSNVRLFGTLGYIVSLFLGYFILEYLKIQDCYFFSSAFFAVSFVLAFFLRSDAPAAVETKNEANLPEKKADMRGIVLFIVFYFFLYGTFNVLMYLLPIHLNGLGM